MPLNEDYYLILTIDFNEKNFDKIIMDNLIPLIHEVNKNL